MHSSINLVEQYVEKLLTEKLSSLYHFHTLDHTREVVDATRLIGLNSELSEEEMEILVLAAWFHDTGHVVTYEGHEEKGVEIAREFLNEHNYPIDNIKQIERIILATKLDHKPGDLLEQIIKDADILHLGKKQSLKKGTLLRNELAEILDRHYSDLDWLEFEVDFYENVEFHTNYAREHYSEGLEKNINKLQRRLKKEDNKMQNVPEDKADEVIEEKPKKIKKKMPERGVETVFRTTSTNHLSLSAIADNKANTLISIGAVIISIVLSFLVNTLEVIPSLMIPTLCLLITCVFTIIFATLSTKPKVTENTISRDDIKNRKGNLLFFGNFYKMKLEDYKWGMTELMKDQEFLYGNLMQDIYFLGLVLAKKYKFLRIAYSVFMYGIIISVLSFIIAFYLISPDV